MGWVWLTLLAVAIPTIPNDGLPGVAFVSPAGGATFDVTVQAPGVDLTVQFAVTNWAYPWINKGVAFTLDGVFDPEHADQALALVQTDDTNPVMLANVPAGQHTLAACLVTYQAKPGGGQWWDLLDRDPSTAGAQNACAALVVNVALQDCWPTVPDPVSGEPVCDPAHPGACCVDDNACSAETCQQVWAPDGSSSYQCRFERASDCCDVDTQCADCAQYDATGACLTPNGCTLDACVDHACVYALDPARAADPDCCQADADCDDGKAGTIDFCERFRCFHQDDPLFCDPEADPPVLCREPTNACWFVTCDLTTHRCEYETWSGLHCDYGCPTPDETNWCWAGTVLDEGPFPCELQDLVPDIGPSITCCQANDDCFDGKVCSTDGCVAHRCLHGDVLPDLGACPSGRCCDTDADADRDGRADACASLDECTAWACVDHCCVPRRPADATACVTARDCDDGDPATTDACVACACVHPPVAACDLANPECDDADPCTTDTCDLGGGQCGHAPVEGCCLAATDCLPAAPDPCSAYACDPISHQCVVATTPGCCTADTDPACDDLDACTADACLAGSCLHQRVTADCCSVVGDCDDSDPCTDDACVPSQVGGDGPGRCQRTVRVASPDGQACCAADTDCADTDPCTADRCSGHRCLNNEISNCCYPDSQDAAQCDDANPCTADWCVYGTCRHLGPQEAPEGFVVPEACCLSDSDCDDGHPNTDDLCAGDGQCLHAVDAAKCDLYVDPPLLCAGELAGCAEPVCNPYGGECVCASTLCDTDADCRVCISTNDIGACTAYNECYTATCVNHACVRAFDLVAWPGCAPECYDGGWLEDDPACDDGNPCTADRCLGGHCLRLEPVDHRHATVGACCAPEFPGWSCDDGDPCTTDACVDNACSYAPIDGCTPPEPAPEQVEPSPEPAVEPPVEASPEPAAEVIEPEVSSDVPAEAQDVGTPDPSTCPLAAPEGACTRPLVCEYGQACCDGACAPTVRCACSDGHWQCAYTGACSPAIDVVAPHEAVASQDALPDESGTAGSGAEDGGCAWYGSRSGPVLPWTLVAAFLALILRRRRAV